MKNESEQYDRFTSIIDFEETGMEIVFTEEEKEQSKKRLMELIKEAEENSK